MGGNIVAIAILAGCIAVAIALVVVVTVVLVVCVVNYRDWKREQ